MPGVFQTSFHQYNGINDYTCIYKTYGFYETRNMFGSYRILLINYAEYFKPEYRVLNGSVNLSHIMVQLI